MSVEQAHWERVYETKDPAEVSWHEDRPAASLAMIRDAGLPLDAAILDVGGGTSRLASELAGLGYTDVTVADISARALREAPGADPTIQTVVADVRSHDFGREFDLWHDRAVFHFMITEQDQEAYLGTLRRTLRAGGHLVIATFGPEGPDRCSGLPVQRYGADQLSSRLGGDFALESTRTVEHRTPAGRTQEFLYARFRRG